MAAEGESAAAMMMMRRRAAEDDHGNRDPSDGGAGGPSDVQAPPSPEVSLHEVLTPERAIDLVGMGSFQRWLTALCMLGNAADAVEVP